MALIKCPECSGNASDKAKSCPHCGCPIGEPKIVPQIERETSETNVPQFPDLPAVLNVGKQIVNWSLNAAIQDVTYSYALNNLTYIKEGKVSVVAHTNGICIYHGLNFGTYTMTKSYTLNVSLINNLNNRINQLSVALS